MPNLSQILRAEIIRISRKEIKAAVSPLRSSNFALKKTVAELRKRLVFLESDNKRLSAFYGKMQEQTPPSSDAASKGRMTAKGVKSLRTKLGLTQAAFGKFLGISNQAVLKMEKKSGRLRLRPITLSNLLSIRGLGKREVRRRLAETKK
ncbi:MAG: helix-turn-helix domain-containing protein [Fibrobacterota bacterium]